MENTAKNFALQLGSLVALYVSMSALIVLLFGVITAQYPDTAQDGYYIYEYTTSSIRFSIALLVVFFPTYLILTRLVNKIRRIEQGTYLALTRWLIYISLLIGGSLLLGDLVYVLNSFLNGELTTRFILKALSFFAVVGAGFAYYLFDAKGYWQNHERTSIQYGVVVSVLVVLALVVGYRNIEAPSEVREMHIDIVQVGDLQNMQYVIEGAYRIDSKLPESINAMYIGLDAPAASEGRDPYTYTVTGPTSYELCAEFAYKSGEAERMQYSMPIYPDVKGTNPYNWDHGAGTWCFKRVVTTPPQITL